MFAPDINEWLPDESSAKSDTAMTIKIETIGVIAKVQGESEAVGATIKQLVAFLTQKSCNVVYDKSINNFIKTLQIAPTLLSRSDLAQQSDLIVVVGGDGTFLSAVRSLAEFKIPILGINLGHLGFLMNISPDSMLTHMEQILQGNYIDEGRFLLQSQIIRNGNIISQADAFNDVVVHIRDVARMVEFETYINGQFVNYQRADGLVVSTPTGSTAYALSSGGPLLHATLDAIALVPICPHTLTNRPLVINASSKVEIVIGNREQTTSQVTFDGQTAFDVRPGDRIVIEKKDHKIHLIHPASYDYYDILRAKLHWSKQL
ncbi:NAD kinase [hydrothermal vent metagenome]|uniref:NAD kinase n=1 Tax=hydrothermal vent metagenome TaxID=652676 RepID=A0A3B0WVM8_9ZZZZ